MCYTQRSGGRFLRAVWDWHHAAGMEPKLEGKGSLALESNLCIPGHFALEGEKAFYRTSGQ
jgi:hypothetical protein